MELFNRKFFMADKDGNKQNQRNPKGGGPGKQDDNFDWSKDYPDGIWLGCSYCCSSYFNAGF